MADSLFVTPKLVKEAAGIRRLNTDPAKWQEDLVQVILTSQPYLQEYNLDIEIKQADPETGTLFATAMVTPKAKMDGMEPVGIPLFASNWQVKPIDVMAVSQGFQPLSQERLERVFPQYQMGDPTMPIPSISNVYMTPLINSPQQTLGANGTGGFADSPKYASLMQAISDTIDRDDVEAFVKAASDPDVLFNLRENGALQEVFSRIDSFTPTDPFPEMERAARELVEPTVMQVYRAGSDYHVKSASAAVYDPIDHPITPIEFDSLDADLKREVLTKGFSTFVANHEKQASDTVGSDSVQIEKVCGCQVFEPGEGPLVGVAVPVVRLNGMKGGVLWFNKEAHACQDRIAGVVVQNDIQPSNLLKTASDDRAYGHGTFMWEYKDGLTALEPMDIRHSVKDGAVQAYSCVTESGRMCTLRKVAGVIALMQVRNDSGEEITILPADARWIPLVGSDIALQKNAEIVKTAAALDELIVKVAGTGTHWTITGDPVTGIPLQDRNNVNRAEAVFVLGALGVQPEDAEAVLSKAAFSSQAVIVPWEVQSKEDMEKYAEAVGAEYARMFNQLTLPGHSLLKAAAAAIQDVNTLDAVLSLGFLNPQNIDTFLNYSPELEESLHQVSELLVAARLGLGVNETDLKTCMETMDRIVSELQYMANDAQEPFKPVGNGGPAPAIPFSMNNQPAGAPAAQPNAGPQPGVPTVPAQGGAVGGAPSNDGAGATAVGR